MEKFCSAVINASPQWNEAKTQLTIEARYTLPDTNIYVLEYTCEVEKTEGKYWAPEGENGKPWVSYSLLIPGKEWLSQVYACSYPNNRMIKQMLFHLVLPDMRRNVLKILRKRYEPQGFGVPGSRQFVIRLEGFPVHLDGKGDFYLAS